MSTSGVSGNLYADDIQRVSAQLNNGLPLPIDPANIDRMRAHMRGEHDDPLSADLLLQLKRI